MKNVERIVQRMPQWFVRLVNGGTVFGAERDPLVISILDLGGIDILRKRGGLRFFKNVEPHLTLSEEELRRIRAELAGEQELVASLLEKTGLKTQLASLAKCAATGGVMTLYITPKQPNS